ncbi:hypothetical protein EYF80_035331 [Liparis tanakae]|uniref:Uncharacterized protein n=1 Tax=Liparis tanakae TaxID=230148 RepID=A0A4Z2GP28_9TELE|nr:hypothetical protein EYF80_035331 [Liparis tanakae]
MAEVNYFLCNLAQVQEQCSSPGAAGMERTEKDGENTGGWNSASSDPLKKTQTIADPTKDESDCRPETVSSAAAATATPGAVSPRESAA